MRVYAHDILYLVFFRSPRRHQVNRRRTLYLLFGLADQVQVIGVAREDVIFTFLDILPLRKPLSYPFVCPYTLADGNHNDVMCKEVNCGTSW